MILIYFCTFRLITISTIWILCQWTVSRQHNSRSLPMTEPFHSQRPEMQAASLRFVILYFFHCVHLYFNSHCMFVSANYPECGRYFDRSGVGRKADFSDRSAEVYHS